MKLIYTKTGEEVKVGDKVLLDDGHEFVVHYFAKPHKSSSEGKVSVSATALNATGTREYYVSVIGAEWIEREDREPLVATPVNEKPKFAIETLKRKQ